MCKEREHSCGMEKKSDRQDACDDGDGLTGEGIVRRIPRILYGPLRLIAELHMRR